MELTQLQQLVVVSQEKVLTQAAEKLNISQPALSRSIQRLEDELGLRLFDRTKNSMTLNVNGEAIVEQAKIVLSDSESLKAKAEALKNKSRHISITTCAPAPLWKLTAEFSASFPTIKISSSMNDEDEIVSLLLSEKSEIAIVRKQIQSEAIKTVPLVNEQLFMQIPLSDPLSKKKSIRFKDLAEKEIREYTKTGFWHKLHRDMIPNAHYIEYDDIMVFMNAIKDGKSLTFVTALANTHNQNRASCVTVPISDKEATAHYHLAFLKKNETSLRTLIGWAVNAAKNW